MSGAPAADPYATFSTPVSAAGADPYAAFATPVSAAPAAKPQPKRSLGQDITGFVSKINRGSGIGDELAATGDAAVTLSRNFLTGKQHLDPKDPNGSLDKAWGDQFQQSLAKQRGTEDAYQAAHPRLSALATGTGNALTAVVPAGDTARAFAVAPRAVNALRGATMAGLTAAGYAVADRGTPQERAAAAADAANPLRNPATFALGGAAGALAPSASRPAQQKISQDVIDLRAKGVQLTHGQARGGLAKAAEDAATSLPILGTEVQNARTAGLESFNHAVANEALAPVGERMPDNIPAGHQTVAHVEKTLGNLYDTTIPQGSVIADPEFKSAINERIGEIALDMTPEGRKRLASILDNRVTSRFGQVKVNPTDMAPAVPGSSAGMAEGIDGATFQRVHSELGTAKGRFSSSQDADQRAIGDALEVMREELRNAAARQNPDFAAKKSAIDQGWAQFKRMQGAAASPGAEGGVFTAPQYGGAVRRADRSVDKGAIARGGALGQDLADSARAVLPNKVPDSGTATRGMIGTVASAPGALIAGAMTGGPVGALGVAGGYAATLSSLKAASKLYSPQAIDAANVALDARISEQQKIAAMSELKRLAMSEPAVTDLYREVAARLSRSAGVTGAQQNALQPANP